MPLVAAVVGVAAVGVQAYSAYASNDNYGEQLDLEKKALDFQMSQAGQAARQGYTTPEKVKAANDSLNATINGVDQTYNMSSGQPVVRGASSVAPPSNAPVGTITPSYVPLLLALAGGYLLLKARK